MRKSPCEDFIIIALHSPRVASVPADFSNISNSLKNWTFLFEKKDNFFCMNTVLNLCLTL